ncbi:MAG: transcription termination factor Rho [Planctomycetaceae bacterium]|nr:transcription termination factor Rho [Planctomycetaceae bacterium]
MSWADGSEGRGDDRGGAPAAQADGPREGFGGGRRGRRRWRDRDEKRGGPFAKDRPARAASPEGEGRALEDVETVDADGDVERGESGGGAAGRGMAEGLLVTDKGGHGKLRRIERMWLPDMKNDVHVSPRLIQKYALRDGSVIRGPYGPGFGKHRYDLVDVTEVDGRSPESVRSLVPFKNLTSIDPDFQYELGDFTKDVALRVIDVICPIGRGQRGLIVAPPRSGKTILLQKIAKGISEHYPDVKLMVLLVDERPEEATEWQRTTKGQVFVSTNDEPPKNHVELAESVWARCRRLVELGDDVILLMDSITRLARAYNNVHGNSGKTMSGGIDSKTMERPKQFFGSARNTETAGSLTILGTTLVETGSKMDQVIFEEFKGTGNMELVLSRKLAERRIFPAIDVERSGTRKEEKLLSSTRLKRVNTLRRVLMRMHFADAMDLLTTKLEAVERNDDFLKRFEVDPDA